MWLLLMLVVAAQTASLAFAERYVEQGMIIYALQVLDQLIDNGEESEDAYALRGHLMMMRGRYEYALTDFEYGLGSEKMAGREGESYANALRVVGECEKAAAIREEIRRWGSLPRNAHIRLYGDQIDDLRYCGHHQQAWSVQDEMGNHFPKAALTHLKAAELYLDERDFDNASRKIWMSQLYFENEAWADTAARLAILEGRYDEAQEWMSYIKTQRIPDRSLMMQLVALKMSNDPSSALHKLEQVRWSFNDNPVLEILKIALMQDLNMDPQEEIDWMKSHCFESCQEQVQFILDLEFGLHFE